MRIKQQRRVLGIAVAVPVMLAMGVGAFAAPPASPDASPVTTGVSPTPPVLEARVKSLIEVDGFSFKDLNANAVLDDYEDWRLPTAERVKDLVAQMSIEEKAGLMLIDTLNAGCEGTVVNPATDYIENQYMHRFIFRNVVAAEFNACGAGGTAVTPEQAAKFTNAVQERSEDTRLGIPALFKSNARNHIDPDTRTGINEASGAFSAFPKEAGIAAAALGDPDYVGVVDDFAGVMGQEWSSIGLRGMYGYMADLSTDPRWYRVHETFTEDPDLNADIMRSLVETLQGPVDENGLSLSPDTDVALTMKHFPGGGPQELGLDPHYAHGKTQVYPGTGDFTNSLKPFQAAIDAGVSSIMPYYGAPIDVTYNGVTYEEEGFAFSDGIVNGLLRDELGFEGYVNSDTGIINDRAWGLETATVPERVAAAINGGTDTLSGFHDVKTILDLIDTELVSQERVDLAAERLLAPLFDLGLFENPYVDPAVATSTIGSDENRELALETQRKSIVLLQNDGQVLPLDESASVYMMGAHNAVQIEDRGYTVVDGNDPANAPGGTNFDAAIETADTAVVNLTAFTNKAATNAYRSNFNDTGWFNPATSTFRDTDDPDTTDDFYVIGGMDPTYGVNSLEMEGVAGLDGKSPWGASDRCVHDGGDAAINNPTPTPACTDNGLRFGGVLPWESGILDFTQMSESMSWTITPELADVRAVMDEIGPENVVLHTYFRQPYVLDEASELLDAGAIVAGFGVTDAALFDVLSGDFAPQGKMPFALATNAEAITSQAPDLPGYDPEDTLFPFGHGLTGYDTVVLDPKVTAAPAQVEPGATVTLTLTGFAPSDTAGDVEVFVGGVLTTSTTVDADGTAIATLSIPADAADGTLEMELRQAGAGIDGITTSVVVRRADKPTERPTVKPSVTPTVKPSVTPTVKPTFRPQDVYTTPGYHDVNGRQWFTKCEPYSVTDRCWTSIWSTQVTADGDEFISKTGWFHNNLTYLPTARSVWSSNSLGYTNAWTSTDGRSWYTECDTAVTGGNGCRSYIRSTVVDSRPVSGGGYTYALTTKWVFNNIVMFK